MARPWTGWKKSPTNNTTLERPEIKLNKRHYYSAKPERYGGAPAHWAAGINGFRTPSAAGRQRLTPVRELD